MRYMMMLKGNESDPEQQGPTPETVAAMGKFNDAMIAAGVLRAAEGLHPSANGVRLRSSGGKVTVTDGPFTETKELLAGYWIIEVGSKEEAIAWAERAPVGGGPDAPADAPPVQIELLRIAGMDDIPVVEGEGDWREREAALRAAPPPAIDQSKKRYLVGFMADADSEADLPPTPDLIAEMGALIGELAAQGKLLEGEGLRPSREGARITFARGKRTVTDGPFAETKELVAGYSIIQVDSKEEAVEWARRAVAVDARGRNGESTIILRQIFNESDFAPEMLEQMPELFATERRLREGSKS